MSNKIKVVIPTDFTVQGDYAMIMIKNLMEQLDMDITFLHVLSVPDTVTMDAQGQIETCGEIDVDYVVTQKEMAEKKLADLKETHGASINTALVLGKTTTGIVEYAESNGYDLIAMGTKGSSGISERIVGSEAQVIARKSSVPVLSLMCDRSDFDMKNMVLVHDFKENGNQELDLMAKILAAFNTKIHFLQISKEGNRDETTILDNMKVFAENNGISAYEPHILKDEDIENGVIHFNQMNNMDMVCIGTHGSGGFFHSSAAERLINHMYKPVISYRIK